MNILVTRFIVKKKKKKKAVHSIPRVTLEHTRIKQFCRIWLWNND